MSKQAGIMATGSKCRDDLGESASEGAFPKDSGVGQTTVNRGDENGQNAAADAGDEFNSVTSQPVDAPDGLDMSSITFF